VNNAIICLTRGYSDLEGYKMLIDRNRSIYNFINKHKTDPYPLIIFHEGNINNNDQKYIADSTPDQNLEFINISHMWDPNYGYQSMCKFFSYYVWDYCKKYDNILRIDEDCKILNCSIDPFDLLKDNIFIAPKWITEGHELTNNTLPYKLEKLLGLPMDTFYNHCFPYNNVCVTNVKFWLNLDILNNLNKIVKEEEFIKNRWGDMPILGSFLNIFAKNKVGYIKNFTYYHQSHTDTISC
jgi:hypothetical protein